MIYVLLVTNLIADVTYLKIQLVGKYATVEIECPFEPKSWFSDKSLSIVVGKDINPNFASKYGLGDVLNLLIYNFTDGDQGRYMCQGIVNGNFRQHTVVVNLCSK